MRLNAVNHLLRDEHGQVRVLITDLEQVLRDGQKIKKTTRRSDPYVWRPGSAMWSHPGRGPARRHPVPFRPRRLSKSGLADFAVVVVLAYDCAGAGTLALAQIGRGPQ